MLSSIKMNYLIACKVVLYGPEGVGKTTMVKTMTNSNYNGYTIGMEHSHKVININGNNVRIDFWDTSGSERFKPFAKGFAHTDSSIIICYSITDRESFVEMQTLYDDLRNSSGQIYIVGTHADKFRQRQVSIEDLQGFCHHYELNGRELCTTDSQSVKDLFENICARASDSGLCRDYRRPSQCIDIPKRKSRLLGYIPGCIPCFKRNKGTEYKSVDDVGLPWEVEERSVDT